MGGPQVGSNSRRVFLLEHSAAIEHRPVLASWKVSIVLLVAAITAVMLPLAQHVYLLGLVLLLGVVCIGPAWFAWQRGSLDPFAPIHVIGLIYFVYFGLGAIWAVQDPTKYAYDRYLVPYIPQAVLYCALGFIAMLWGYMGPWWKRRSTTGPAFAVPGLMFMVVPAVAGAVGYLSDAALSHSRWLGVTGPRIISGAAQLSPLFLYVWALGWLLVFSGQATKGQRRLVLFAFLPMTALILSVSMTNKSGSMTLVGMPLIALWYGRRKLPWKSLAALVLILVFVVFPVYNTFRVLDARIPQAKRLALTADIIADWDLDDYSDRSIGVVKYRLAMINSVAVVIRDVGRWVPFANGETIFLPTIAFFIPHFIWADKPSFTMGRDVAETFRVVHILDNSTRIEITVPGELYWNFDLPGIILGMALWGFVMRFFYRRYAEFEELDPVHRAIHLVLIAQWVHFGGGLAAQTVAVMRTLLMIEIYIIVARQFGLLGWRSSRPASAVQATVPAVMRG